MYFPANLHLVKAKYRFIVFKIMTNIQGTDKIYSAYPNWTPNSIAYIRSLKWENNKLVILACCQVIKEVTGWPDHTKPFFEVEFYFDNVLNLKLSFTGINKQQVTGFDIIDLSQNGLENINFQIEDYENAVIGFTCKTIEIIEVSAPFKLVLGESEI